MGEWKFAQMFLVTWPRWPTCPYMVKTLKNLLLWNQKANDLESWYANIGCSSTSKFGQMTTLGWPWPILWQGQIWFLLLLYGKTETVVVYDVRVGRCSKLDECMNLYEYQRSRSFIDLHPRSLRFTFSNFFSLETSRPIEAKFHVKPPWDMGMKICSNGLCHMNNMATMPIYGKNLNKSSSKFIQMMTLSWPWSILRQGQIWSLMLLYGKKVN